MDTAFTELHVERVPLSSIHPDPANVRLHDERGLEAIRGSLARFGQQKPIVVDHNGVIRAGNGTYVAAKALGWETIQVVVTDLEGVESTAYAIADNRTSDLSAFDMPSLGALLEELQTEDAFDGIGFDSADIDEILDSLANETAELEQDEVASPAIDSSRWSGELTRRRWLATASMEPSR